MPKFSSLVLTALVYHCHLCDKAYLVPFLVIASKSSSCLSGFVVWGGVGGGGRAFCFSGAEDWTQQGFVFLGKCSITKLSLSMCLLKEHSPQLKKY